MAKVLLVEDDNNLREIYEARLQAEGYTIVSAQDGEAALVVAKQERPDLIISDVMMPKISGFEMLDILRNTDGLKDVKIIMLTALGQAEDKTRADSLGANKYLVKSQVTLEDIVKTAHQLLDDEPAAPAGAPAAEAIPAATEQATAASTAAQGQPTTPVTSETPATSSAADTTPSAPTPVSTPPPTIPLATPLAEPNSPPAIAAPASTLTTPPEPAVPSTPAPSLDEAASSPSTPLAATPTVAEPASTASTSQAAASPTLVTPESAAPMAAPNPAVVQSTTEAAGAETTAEEQANMQATIDNFVSQPAAPASPAPEPAAMGPAIGAPMDTNTLVPQTNDTAASDQQLVSSAVDSLVADTAAQRPSDVTAVEVPAVPASPSATPQPEESETIPEPSATPPAPTGGDGVSIAHKKVIQPINDLNNKTDINELLAREAAKEQAGSAPANSMAAPTEEQAASGTPAIPNPPESTSETSTPPTLPKDDVDPNNIAL